MLAMTARLIIILIAYMAKDAEPLFAQLSFRPGVSVESYGGVATYGRFLEQIFREEHVSGGIGIVEGERELTARPGLATGGAIALWPWDKSSVRASFMYASTELVFRDDTGTGATRLDLDDLANLSCFTFSLELLRFLLDETKRVAPYAVGGVAGVLWKLDVDAAADDAVILTNQGDDTQRRFGGVGGAGLQIRAADRLTVRLEATTYGLGNPFDGRDAFRVAPGHIRARGQTIDEPGTVRLTRLTAGLSYALGGR